MTTALTITRAIRAMQKATGKEAAVEIVNGVIRVIPVDTANRPQDARGIDGKRNSNPANLAQWREKRGEGKAYGRP